VTKIEKLRRFLKSTPKGWADMTRKSRLAAASKVSGMTIGSVAVAVSTHSDLRQAFGLSSVTSKRPNRRSVARSAPDTSKAASGAVLAARNAIDLMSLEQLVETSGYLNRALVKKARGL
jgi:hypothetical protein